MCKRNCLVGKRFGWLTVIAEAGRSKDRHIRYECVCECGARKVVSGNCLISGKSRSCGCKKNTKHGASRLQNRERLYDVWCAMRRRCKGVNSQDYHNYGGRGIKICDEWDEYDNFRKWAYENGYKDDAPKGECTIDRIDVDGDYTPDNCRWVDASMQMFNKRRQKSKLGIRGVYFRDRENKFCAMIVKNRKHIYLGSYERIEDAVTARKDAEMKYYGMVLDK